MIRWFLRLFPYVRQLEVDLDHAAEEYGRLADIKRRQQEFINELNDRIKSVEVSLSCWSAPE